MHSEIHGFHADSPVQGGGLASKYRCMEVAVSMPHHLGDGLVVGESTRSISPCDEKAAACCDTKTGLPREFHPGAQALLRELLGLLLDVVGGSIQIPGLVGVPQTTGRCRSPETCAFCGHEIHPRSRNGC